MVQKFTVLFIALMFAVFADHITAGEHDEFNFALENTDKVLLDKTLLIAQKDEVFEKFCSAAIESNDANAQFTLGLFYATGNAAKQNKHLAALLFNLAAEQQHQLALDWLMQLDGDPTLADLPACNKHFRRERTALNNSHPPGLS